MTMNGENNITRFYLSNYNTADSANIKTSGTLDQLVAGDIAFVTLQNTIMDLSTNTALHKPSLAKKFRIAVKETSEDKYRLTDVIEYDNFISNTVVSGSAPQERVTYLGYNGTDGNLDDPSTIGDYVIHVELKSKLKATGDYPLFKVGAYRSLSSDTPKELATGLVISLNKMFERESKFEQFVRIERVANGTFGTTVSNVQVNKGSKYVYKTSHSIAVGSIVRFGYSSTSTTDPVYIVTESNTNDFVLDTPYQGENSTTIECFVNTVAPTLWGIKFVGVPRKFDERKKFPYQKADWNIQLSGDFVSTPNRVKQNYLEGKGTYEELAQMEYDLRLNEVLPQVINIPVIIPYKCASALGGKQVTSDKDGVVKIADGTTSVTPSYNYFICKWKTANYGNQITNPVYAEKVIVIATGYTSTTADSLLTDIVI